MKFTWNLARAARVATAALVGVLMFATTASAQLLNFNNPGHPSLAPPGVTPSFSYPFMELTRPTFSNPHPEVVGSATYGGGVLSIKTHPQWVTFASAPGWFNAGFVAQASDESTSPCGFACGSFTINARIDAQTGLLVGVPSDIDVVFRGHTTLSHWQCPDGSQDLSTCPGTEVSVTDADLNGTLLTGRVVDFAGVAGGGTGQFQFRIRVTGGLLTDPFGADANGISWCAAGAFCFANPADLLQPSGFDLGINIVSAQVTGGFATPGGFTGTASGTAGSIPRLEMLNCYGIIGDRVWNDLNQNGIQDVDEPGIAGAGVTLLHGTDAPKFQTTDANGNFLFSRVCGGDNQLDVASPAGYTASPSGLGGDPELDSNGSGVSVNLASGAVDRSVDFGFFQVPVVSSAYTTFTQGAWGAKPKPGNAAQILVDYFDLMYPTGEAIIGIPNTAGRHSITVTGAAAVQTFLPQGGLPWKLDRSYVDPAHISLPKHFGKFKGHFMIGQLAGNVLALKFNIDMSNLGLTRVGLANLKVKSGTYVGKTVAQIYALANGALAGDPQSSALNYFLLNDVVEKINKNYNAGTTNKGFLGQ